MKKFLKILFIGILLLVLLVTAALGYFLGTDSGLQSLMTIAQKFVPPDSLKCTQLSGRILGDLTMKECRFQDGDLKVTLNQGRLVWYPSKLFRGELDVETLDVSGFELKLPKPAPPPPDEPPFQFKGLDLPLAPRLHNVHLKNIQIWTYDAKKPFVIKEVNLDTHGQSQKLVLSAFKIQLPEGYLQASGQAQLTEQLPVDLKLQGQYQLPETGKITFDATAKGPVADKVNVQANVKGPATVSLQAALLHAFDDPAWQVSLKAKLGKMPNLPPVVTQSGLQVQVQGNGRGNRYQATINASGTLPETGPVTVLVKANGDDKRLSLKQLQIAGKTLPLRLTLNGTMDYADQKMAINGRWQNLNLPLQGDPALQSPKGTLTVNGTPKKYRFAIKAPITVKDAGNWLLDLQGQGTEKAVQLDKLHLDGAQTKTRVQVAGKFGFTDQRYQATVNWQQLQWPQQGPLLLTSNKGQLTADGDLKNYRFQGKLDVQGPDIPAANIALRGQGDQQQLSSMAVDVDTLGGTVNIDGLLSWKEGLSWQTTIGTKNIDPGKKWPAVPGSLTTKLKSTGEITSQKRTISADLESLSGNLMNNPLAGSGRITMVNDRLDIRELRLTSRATRVNLNGYLDITPGKESLAMDWRLAVPQLQNWLKEFKGNIQGQGKISGPLQRPRISLKTFADNLSMPGVTIRRADITGDVDLAPDRVSRLQLIAQDLVTGSDQWKRAELDLKGRVENHVLKIGAEGDLGKLALIADGGFNEKSQEWRGNLQHLLIDSPLAQGRWQLAKPTFLDASAKKVASGPGCLVNKGAELCWKGGWEGNTGVGAKIDIKNVDLARFSRMLPTDVDIRSVLSGHVDFVQPVKGPMNVTVSMRLSGGELLLPASKGQRLKIALPAGEFLKAVTDGQNARAQLNFRAANIVDLQADVEARDLPRGGAAGLSGRLKINATNLDWVPLFVTDIDHIAGRLNSDITISGTIEKPAIGGLLQLQNGAVKIDQYGMNYTNINVLAKSDGRGVLNVTGGITGGKGQLNITGKIVPMEKQLQIHIAGDRFQAMDSYNLRVRIDPNLDIVMTAQETRLTGKIVVTDAFISPQGFSSNAPSQVKPSPDVVIVKGNAPRDATVTLQQKSKMTRSALYAKLRIVLKNKVYVDAFDFHGYLTGNLVIEKSPGLFPRGNGSISIGKGNYIVYGQQLAIDRGRVLFSNTPIDNPSLDFQVSRTLDNTNPAKDTGDEGKITVGAEITGPLKKPKLTLFSNPQMPDNAILSALAFGTMPEQGGDPTQGTSFVVGKYITPDLYVGYGIGLFGALDTFILRYNIFRRLQLEATRNDQTTAVDLLYILELK